MSRDNWAAQVAWEVAKGQVEGKIYSLGENAYGSRLRSVIPGIEPLRDPTYRQDICGTEGWPSTLDENDVIVVLSGGHINQAMRSASRSPCRVIHFFDLLRFTDLPLGEAVMNEGFAQVQRDYAESFSAARELFCDEASREIFDKVLVFRRTLDVTATPMERDLQGKQYFEAFLPRGISQFIDAGAFDGDTIRRFLSWARASEWGSSHVDEVVAIEPSTDLCARIREHFVDVPIDIFNVALGSAPGWVVIEGEGSTARVASTSALPIGEIAGIQQRTLDSIVGELIEARRLSSQRSSYLKLDIEGSELDALRGGTDFLSANQPCVAVAVYHSPKDLFQIPLFLRDELPRHSLHFRHYTESLYESVVYAVAP